MSDTPRSPSHPRWTAHSLPPDSSASAHAPPVEDPPPPDRPSSPRIHVLPGEARGDRSGTVLADQFDLLKKIGSGGMGDVYEARFRPDRRRYALKLLTGAPARDPLLIARFEHEYRALSQVRHPAIVRVFYFGVLPTGERFYTMQLLRGATLEEHLRRRGPLAPARVVAIALQLCQALARLHARGVLHRDLKPANIFLLRDSRRPDAPRDRIKLLDLGIAKLTAAFYASDANTTPPEDRLRTRAGVVLGTPGYIAPELLHGDRDPHPRHDIFALGVTLFKVATGTSPYAHPHAAAVGDPPRPAPNLPSSLEQLLHTALAADPIARYQSIAELQDDLDLIHTELTAIAHTGETSPKRPSNPSTPRPHSSPKRLAPPPIEATHEPAAPQPTDHPARSRDASSTSTLKSISQGLTRSIPWLVAAALALGWLADARLLNIQPRDLIARTHAHASSLARAANIALPTNHTPTSLAPAIASETIRDTTGSPHASPTTSAAQHDPATSTTSEPPSTSQPELTSLTATSPTPNNRPEHTTTGEPSPRRSQDATSPAAPSPSPPASLKRADILRALADRRAALDLCLPGDGPIDLHLVIAADGHLRRATLTPSGSTIAQQCIAEALQDLRLPAAGAPSTHTLRLRDR